MIIIDFHYGPTISPKEGGLIIIPDHATKALRVRCDLTLELHTKSTPGTDAYRLIH